MYKPEDFAIAGCIATIARDGALQVIQGLVSPDDIPKQTASATDAGTDPGDGDHADTGADAGRIAGPAMSAPMQLPKDREAEARKEAGVGIGLADDLRSVRSALAKAHLAGDFDAAFDLMLFQLGRSVFTDGYKSHALDIAVRETADRPTMRMNDDEFANWSPGEAMLADRSRLSFDWLEIEDDGDSFAALRAIPQADKQALFAACVARTVKGQLAFEPQARPELEATVARLDIDFAKHVRPTADMLWSRINKSRILDIARTVLGPAWASARAKNKKPAIAEAMEQAFAAGDPPVGVSTAMHAAALAWVPPGFAAFDTGRVDAEAGEDAAAAPPAADASASDAGTAAGTAPVESAEAPAEHEADPAHGNRAGDATDGALPGEPDAGAADTAPESGAADIDGTVGAMPPIPINGHDGVPDPLEIPEFLRRVR